MMVGSGCATSIVEPLCLPSRPTLINVTNMEKYELYLVNPTTVESLALNDERLKNHIETIEAITEAHNEQFKASCP
jgi:hypothetical protein